MQHNLHADKPHFCFVYMYWLGVNPEILLNHGELREGVPCLLPNEDVFLSNLEETFFLMKTKSMTEVTHKERTC